MAGPKKHLQNFREKVDGGYIYEGKYYSLAGDERWRKETFRKLLAFGVLLTALTVGSGCIDAAGATNAYYVILPFVGEVCCVFVLMWNLFRLTGSGDKVKGYIYESAKPKLDGALVLLMAFAGAGFVFSLIYQVCHGFEGEALKCIIYLTLKLVTAAGAGLYKRYFKGLQWESVKSQP